MIKADYRSWWHRAKCFFNDAEAKECEKMLEAVEKQARNIVNKTAVHQAVCKIVSASQPDFVRERDGFLKLINCSSK